MPEIKRTNSENPDFLHLVQQLDAYLAERDGTEHAFYDQFNKVAAIGHVITVYKEGEAVACGAIKAYAPGVMEVKRMFTKPSSRGEGLAAMVLAALENWARELGYSRCILETGKRQPEANALYKKCGYTIIPNYSPYEGVENSVCYEKWLG
jgi:GNAT superfamily N-acetyltransferase